MPAHRELDSLWVLLARIVIIDRIVGITRTFFPNRPVFIHGNRFEPFPPTSYRHSFGFARRTATARSRILVAASYQPAGAFAWPGPAAAGTLFQQEHPVRDDCPQLGSRKCNVLAAPRGLPLRRRARTAFCRLPNPRANCRLGMERLWRFAGSLGPRHVARFQRGERGIDLRVGPALAWTDRGARGRLDAGSGSGLADLRSELHARIVPGIVHAGYVPCFRSLAFW